MKIETSSTSTSVHNKFGFGFHVNVKIDPKLCQGGGLGAVVIVCTPTAGYELDSTLFAIEQTLGGTVQ
eukprot:5919452-Ditylum_brightwellii.AAC.1